MMRHRQNTPRAASRFARAMLISIAMLASSVVSAQEIATLQGHTANVRADAVNPADTTWSANGGREGPGGRT